MRDGLLDLSNRGSSDSIRRRRVSFVEHLNPSQHPPGALGLLGSLVGEGRHMSVTGRTSCPALHVRKALHLLGKSPRALLHVAMR